MVLSNDLFTVIMTHVREKVLLSYLLTAQWGAGNSRRARQAPEDPFQRVSTHSAIINRDINNYD